MTLTELAERLGSPPRQIRYLIAEGILPPAGETGRGADGYNETHVWHGEKFRKLSNLGFTIRAIKLMLDNGIVSMEPDVGRPIFQNAAVELRIRDAAPLAKMNDEQTKQTIRDISDAIDKARQSAT